MSIGHTAGTKSTQNILSMKEAEPRRLHAIKTPMIEHSGKGNTKKPEPGRGRGERQSAERFQGNKTALHDAVMAVRRLSKLVARTTPRANPSARRRLWLMAMSAR